VAISSEILSKVALWGVGLLGIVAVVMMYRSFTAGDRVPNPDYPVVCVATGELFELDPDDVTGFPAVNPKTGQATLLPYEKREDGLYVNAHFREAFELDSIKEANHYVDVESLRVTRTP